MDLLQVTKDLCQIYSETGKGGTLETMNICQAALPEAVVSFRHSSSELAADDILLSLKGEGNKRLLLLGHYDTVPGNKIISEDSTKFYALGSFDMKGGVAIALSLAASLDRKDYKEVLVLLSGDEEWRSNPFEAPEGNFDAVLAFEGGEPSGLVSNRFGAATLELICQGEAIRATHPLASESSILALSELALETNASNTTSAHYSATSLFSKDAINVVPAEARLSGILRYQTRSSRDNYLESLPQNIRGLVISCEYNELFPPLESTGDTESLLNELMIPFISRSGAGDISWLCEFAPILIDGLGPYGGDEHSPNEWIDIASLETQLIRAKLVANQILGC